MKLRQDNVFTPVCDSVHRGWGSLSRGVSVQWVSVQGVSVRETPTAIRVCAGGTHPTGMHPCSIILLKVIVSKSLVENIPICSIVISTTKTDVSELPFIFVYFLGYQISIRKFIMETVVSVMLHHQCTENLDNIT